MSHQITDITARACEVLRTKIANVRNGRVLGTLKKRELPCVSVFAAGRASSVFQTAPMQYQHAVTLVTAIAVQAVDGAENTAQELLGLVEGLFYASPTLHKELADDLHPLTLDIEADDGGEEPVVWYYQTWRAVYFDDADVYVGDAAWHSEADIVDWHSHYTDWQLKNSNERIDARDQNPKG